MRTQEDEVITSIRDHGKLILKPILRQVKNMDTNTKKEVLQKTT